MATNTHRERLEQLFSKRTVVNLPSLREELGGVSAMTVFRHLKQLPYRSSYNHKGRYYALHDPARYDRFGLWSIDGIHFSIDGSLRKTVRRLVEEAEAGTTQQELRHTLQVRVHNTLLDLLRHGEIEREQLLQVYVYLHSDPEVRAVQLERRQQLLEGVDAETATLDRERDAEVVVQILLTLLRHRGASAEEVARRLRGRSPPIPIDQVRAVFDRYALDELGEKGGTSRS